MNHGLSDSTAAAIRQVLRRYPEVERAVLYGSRAKGTHKPGSDIDLTLSGHGIGLRELGDIAEALDELLLPYKIDLSNLEQVDRADLLDHIRRVGVVFYARESGLDDPLDAASTSMPAQEG